MRNFIANSVRILGICKDFSASVHDFHYLKDVLWEYRDCMVLGDKGYLSTEVQKNLFEGADLAFCMYRVKVCRGSLCHGLLQMS